MTPLCRRRAWLRKRRSNHSRASPVAHLPQVFEGLGRLPLAPGGDLLGHVGRGQPQPPGEDDHPFEGVLQLADVAGPRVVDQQLHGLVVDVAREPRRRAGPGPPQEVLHEERHVRAPVAQRRQFDGDHVQPVEQVLPEAPPPHLGGQVDVGGGHDADIGEQGVIAADALVAALLQNAQQPQLHAGVGGAHLVEEHGPAAGLLEAALALAHGAGEGAFLMPEQFRLEDALGQGRAVDLDEGAAPPGAAVVEHPGQHPLAGAALTLEQDGGLGVGHAQHLHQDAAHVGALRSQERVAGAAAMERGGVGLDLKPGLPGSGGAVHGGSPSPFVLRVIPRAGRSHSEFRTSPLPGRRHGGDGLTPGAGASPAGTGRHPSACVAAIDQDRRRAFA